MGTFWEPWGNLVGTLREPWGTLGTLREPCGNLEGTLRNLGNLEGTLGTFTWEPLLGNLYLGTLEPLPGNLYLEPGNLGEMGFGAAPVCSETFTMAEDPKEFCCWGIILGYPRSPCSPFASFIFLQRLSSWSFWSYRSTLRTCKSYRPSIKIPKAIIIIIQQVLFTKCRLLWKNKYDFFAFVHFWFSILFLVPCCSLL